MSEEEYDYSRWNRFSRITIPVVFWSIIGSCFVWKICGFPFFIDYDKNLNINFYSTICNTISVFGLGVAIWQIAELESRQKQIQKATKEEHDKVKNVNDIDRIIKTKGTIGHVKTLIINNNLEDADVLVQALKDELNRCNKICVDTSDEDILGKVQTCAVELDTFRISMNKERLSTVKNAQMLNKALMLGTLDQMSELFEFIIDICKDK